MNIPKYTKNILAAKNLKITAFTYFLERYIVSRAVLDIKETHTVAIKKDSWKNIYSRLRINQ